MDAEPIEKSQVQKKKRIPGILRRRRSVRRSADRCESSPIMAGQLSRQGSVREMVHTSLVPPELLREDSAVSVQADCIKRGRCLKMCRWQRSPRPSAHLRQHPCLLRLSQLHPFCLPLQQPTSLRSEKMPCLCMHGFGPIHATQYSAHVTGGAHWAEGTCLSARWTDMVG